MADNILEVKHLKKYFKTGRGMLHAVDDINFTLERGKTLGLVGESGCGKSTTGRVILRLLEPTSGEIIFEGKDVSKLSKKEMRHMRKDMQIIFQDPFSSLDPKKTVSQIIAEPIIENKILKGKHAIEERVLELMETVGLAERYINTYPHELDGGRRQRIGIARALAMKPEILFFDEPTSALDPEITAGILKVLRQLADENMTMVIVTHEIDFARKVADRVIFMDEGVIIEEGDPKQVLDNPSNERTKAFLQKLEV